MRVKTSFEVMDEVGVRSYMRLVRLNERDIVVRLAMGVGTSGSGLVSLKSSMNCGESHSLIPSVLILWGS